MIDPRSGVLNERLGEVGSVSRVRGLVLGAPRGAGRGQPSCPAVGTPTPPVGKGHTNGTHRAEPEREVEESPRKATKKQTAGRGIEDRMSSPRVRDSPLEHGLVVMVRPCEPVLESHSPIIDLGGR